MNETRRTNPLAGKTRSIGKVIVERNGGDWLAMFPDGEVNIFPSAQAAQKAIASWARSETGRDEACVYVIEWRAR